MRVTITLKPKRRKPFTSTTWEADDPLLDAAVYGVLMCWRLTRPDDLAA